MYTQCPSCKTVFNVKPEQLGAARGKVRCSRCQTVFNARENPYNQSSTPAEEKAPPPRAKPQTRPQPASKPTTKTTPQNKAQPEAKPAQQPQNTTPPAAEKKPADEWFDLAPTPAADKPVAKTKAPSAPPQARQTTSNAQPLSIEDELNDDLFSLFNEPESPEAEPVAQSRGTEKKEEKTERNDIDIETTAADETPSTPEQSVKEAEATAEGRGTEDEKEAPATGNYSLPPQLESRPVRSTMRNLLYALSNLMLIAALALQYAYSYRIPLRENEALRPWLDTLCQLSECPMPPKRNLEKIELVDNMMQSHPRYQDSLLVTATLINRADYVQPYPIVEITMSDLKQKEVARRMFRPEEYLTGDIAKTGFTPNVEIALMLEMADPGDNAVGFKFDFY